MAKVRLPNALKTKQPPVDYDLPEGGPFITISREPGCHGFSLGLLLQELLNDLAPAGKAWRLFSREILQRLAEETQIDVDTLNKERHSKPSVMTDMFRTFSDKHMPSGLAIRNRITVIIRSEAAKGYAILLGQGGAGATSDMPNGLSVRLEAPLNWRAKQVAFRDGISLANAKELIIKMEEERQYLRKIYETRFPRKPAFHLVFDCSIFTLAQIARQIVFAMKLRHQV